MDNHDYLVDNVNSKSPVDSDHEVRCTQKCSYQQDESTENCSFQQYGACGNNMLVNKVKIKALNHLAKNDLWINSFI